MVAAELSYPVRQPAWVLTYSGQNITADITTMVTEIMFSDTSGAHHHHRGRHSMAETDQVEVTLEDRDRRWQGPWSPMRGAVVSLQIGYVGEEFLDCGYFQVDELELKGPPDTFHLKCIAAGITPSLRTPRSAVYESQTLMQVASTIAARNGLKVVGSPEDINPTWQRLSQSRETDLAFLRRLALAHNYDFTIRGQKLIFYSRTQLEQAAPVALVQRTQTKSFEFKTKTQKIYNACSVFYQHPFQKNLIGARYQDPDAPTGDDLHIVARCENPHQAQLKARSALHDANMMEVTGRIETEGALLLVAGVNIAIQGFSTFDGNYHINSSKHRLERGSGYSTEIEVRQL